MSIDWQNFTPWASLSGGLLLGLGVAIFLLLNGRVAGVSGILGGLLRPAGGEVGWRLAFLGGLVVAPSLYGLLRPLPPFEVDAGAAMLIVGGLLVGFGTRYGSGCTSGHGVCGISRLSPRSFAATAAFVSAGFLTVYLLRHVLA